MKLHTHARGVPVRPNPKRVLQFAIDCAVW
jgi:hypothetical protein